MDEEQIQTDIKREKMANENVQLINNINNAFVEFVAPDRGRGNFRNRGSGSGNFRFFRNNFNTFNPNYNNPPRNNFQNGNRPRGGFRNFVYFNPNRNWPPFQRQNDYNNSGNCNNNNFRGNNNNRFNRGRSRGRGGYKVNNVETRNQGHNSASESYSTSSMDIIQIFCQY